MKKNTSVILLTVAVLASLFLMSCSNDDDDDDEVEEVGEVFNEELYGKWTLFVLHEREYVNGTFESERYYKFGEDEISDLTFYENSTFYKYESFYGVRENEKGTYSFDGDVLTLTLEDGSKYASNVELYQEYFIIHSSEEFEENGDTYRHEREWKYR
ncbi:lipocalin family protein [Pseudotamlana agarivorans]|uniref:lipocalin family protein n=1 Tax=Pseudotamlana agarivorans TaxID=481183 RepID=UPI0008379E4D|nr:lipocalin family protein [Tamlana agarivorans]